MKFLTTNEIEAIIADPILEQLFDAFVRPAKNQKLAWNVIYQWVYPLYKNHA
jgi:hypothetical protein